MGHAPSVEGIYQQYKDDGLLSVVVLGEGAGGQPSSAVDAQTWAQQFGQTGVVVVDPAWSSNTPIPWGEFAGGGNFNFALPGLGLIGRGLEIITLSHPTEAQIEAALDAPYDPGASDSGGEEDSGDPTADPDLPPCENFGNAFDNCGWPANWSPPMFCEGCSYPATWDNPTAQCEDLIASGDALYGDGCATTLTYWFACLTLSCDLGAGCGPQLNQVAQYCG